MFVRHPRSSRYVHHDALADFVAGRGLVEGAPLKDRSGREWEGRARRPLATQDDARPVARSPQGAYLDMSGPGHDAFHADPTALPEEIPMPAAHMVTTHAFGAGSYSFFWGDVFVYLRQTGPGWPLAMSRLHGTGMHSMLRSKNRHTKGMVGQRCVGVHREATAGQLGPRPAKAASTAGGSAASSG